MCIDYRCIDYMCIDLLCMDLLCIEIVCIDFPECVKYRKQSSLNLNFVLDLQFECWDDERIQFCQQYQLPHSSLIERHFEVLMLQIRGNSETSASDMSFKCPPCPLSKQCTFQTEDKKMICWCDGAHRVQETMILVFFAVGTCQRPETIGSGGMTHAGSRNKKVGGPYP